VLGESTKAVQNAAKVHTLNDLVRFQKLKPEVDDKTAKESLRPEALSANPLTTYARPRTHRRTDNPKT